MARKPKQLTNFEMVTEFNKALGQGVKEQPCIPHINQVKLRLDLIKEEAIDEAIQALVSRDLVAVGDAIADALVVVYGLANDCGMDADKLMKAVHESNMSKLCDSEEKAKKAADLYREGNGFHGKTEPIQAGIRPCPSDDTKFIVFNEQTGKTLKGPDFITPAAALAEAIFPNGEPVDKYTPMRKDALARFEKGEMSIEDYWGFNATLDSMQ